MPDALTARIEAAIAAEAATRSAQAPAGVSGPEAAAGTSARPAGARGAGARGAGGRGAAGPARDGRRQRGTPGRSRLTLRIAFAAAAVVVIAGGGFGVSRLFLGGPALNGASSSASGTGLPAREPGAGPSQHSISENAPPGAGGSAAGSPSGGEHAATGSPAGYPVVASGTNYRAGQLKAQVKATLIKFHRPQPAHPGGTMSPAPFSRVTLCLAGVVKDQRPRLVDMAQYEGEPATVVVVPAGAHTLRALVFSQHCPAAGASPLDSATLPSPG
jgi:hypothetical protein